MLHNFSYYVYLFSVHVSGDYVPIIRRNNCIYATLGTFYSAWVTLWHAAWKSALHARQSSIQNNKYQVSHKYSCFFWWWAHSHPKHIEKINKHTKKICATSWLYLLYYTRMHGQQNIKKLERGFRRNFGENTKYGIIFYYICSVMMDKKYLCMHISISHKWILLEQHVLYQISVVIS